MSKRFDFSGSPHIPFLKRIRIHPLFPFWIKQIGLYIWFLLLIFFTSIFFSVFTSAQEFLRGFHIPIVFHERPKNTQEIQKEIQVFIAEIQPILSQAESVLPPNEYSYQAEILTSMKRLLQNLGIFEQALPSFEQAFQEGVQKGSFESLLSLLHKYDTALTSLSSDTVFLFDHVKKIPILSNRLKPYESIISEVYPVVKQFPQFLNAFYAATGDIQPHHLVIWLQNSNEKRATGGFIGSFADVFFNDGKIISFKIQDIYTYDGQMQDSGAPPELAKTLVGNHTWSLRDSNYHPIFSVSAKTFMDMYEKAGGETVDTIIAIDQSFIEDLLDVVGGIDLPEYDIHLSGKNFSLVLSYIVEGKFTAHNPKSFISERIFPLLKEVVLKNKNGKKLIELYYKQKSSIQVFSRESSIQNVGTILEIGKNREKILKDNTEILLNEISISGNKSDAYVSKEIHLEEKNEHGARVVTFILDRFHNWGGEQEQSYAYLKKHIGEPKISEKEHENILGKGSNHAVFQLFLPKEAKEIQCNHAEFFRIFPADEKEVLEFITPLLAPGQKQTLSCSFHLPLSFRAIKIFDSQAK